MDAKIEYPVSLNGKNEIVDRYGNIVLPDITLFKFDVSGMMNRAFDHVERQRNIGEHIVFLMNGFAFGTIKEMTDAVMANGDVEEKPEEKPRSRNPWGRNGKPK